MNAVRPVLRILHPLLCSLLVGAVAPAQDEAGPRELRYYEALLRNPRPSTSFDRWYQEALESGRSGRLLDEQQRAVEAAPDELAPRLILGLLHERLGQNDAALATFTAATERHPEAFLPWWSCARLHSDRDEPEPARLCWRRALDLCPDEARHGDLALQLARVEWRLGDRVAAERLLDELRRRHRGDRHLRSSLAELLEEEGDDVGAIEEWSALRSDFGLDLSFAYQCTMAIGRLHEARFEWSEACEAYERELDRVDPASWQARELSIRIEKAYASSDDADAYRDHLQERVRQRPADEATRLRLARVLERRGEIEEARAQLVAAAGIEPRSAEVRRAQIGLEERQGALDAAIARAEDWSRLSPRLDEAWVSVGRLYTERACDLTREEARRDPDVEAALAAWRRMIETDPDDAGAALRAASLCQDAHLRWVMCLAMEFGIPQDEDSPFLEPAEDFLREAVRRRPDDPETHRALGELLERRARPAEALAAWRRIAEPPRDDAPHLRLLAQTLRRPRPEQALAVARHAIELDPTELGFHERALQWQIAAAREEDRLALQEALHRFAALEPTPEHLHRCLELWVGLDEQLGTEQGTPSPASAIPGGLLGRAWLQAKRHARARRHEDALEALDRCVRLAPDHAPLPVARAETLELLGRDEEALGAWRALAEAHPDHAVLALEKVVEIERGRDLDRACAAARELTRLAPERTESWIILSSLLQDGRRLGEACEVMARALRLAPEDVMLRSRYAQLLRLRSLTLGLAEEERAKEMHHEALEHLWRCYELADDASLRRGITRELASLALESDRLDSLLQRIRNRRDVDEPRDVALNLYEALRAAGRDDEAERVVSRLAERSPHEIEALRLLVQFHEHRGDLDVAADLLERVVQASSERAELLRLGRLRLALKDAAGLERTWRVLLATPGGEGLLQAEIDSLLRKGALDEARQLCRIGLDAPTPAPWPLVDRALLLAADADDDELRQRCTLILSRLPPTPELASATASGPWNTPGNDILQPPPSWARGGVLIVAPLAEGIDDRDLDPWLSPVAVTGPVPVDRVALGTVWSHGWTRRSESSRGWPHEGFADLQECARLVAQIHDLLANRRHEPRLRGPRIAQALATTPDQARLRARALQHHATLQQLAEDLVDWERRQQGTPDPIQLRELACLAWCHGHVPMARRLARRAAEHDDDAVLHLAMDLLVPYLTLARMAEGRAEEAEQRALPLDLEQAGRAMRAWEQRRPEPLRCHLAERLIPIAVDCGHDALAGEWLDWAMQSEELHGLLLLSDAVRATGDRATERAYVDRLRRLADDEVAAATRITLCWTLARHADAEGFDVVIELLRPCLSDASASSTPVARWWRPEDEIEIEGTRGRLAFVLDRAHSGQLVELPPPFPGADPKLGPQELELLRSLAIRAQELGRIEDLLVAVDEADDPRWSAQRASRVWARWWSERRDEALRLLEASQWPEDGGSARPLRALLRIENAQHREAEGLLAASDPHFPDDLRRALRHHMLRRQLSGDVRHALAGLELQLERPESALDCYLPRHDELGSPEAATTQDLSFDPRLQGFPTRNDRPACAVPLPRMLDHAQREGRLARIHELALAAADRAPEDPAAQTLAALTSLRIGQPAAAQNALHRLPRTLQPEAAAEEWLVDAALLDRTTRPWGRDRALRLIVEASGVGETALAHRVWRRLLSVLGSGAAADLAQVLDASVQSSADGEEPGLAARQLRGWLGEFFDASPAADQPALLPLFFGLIVSAAPVPLDDAIALHWMPSRALRHEAALDDSARTQVHLDLRRALFPDGLDQAPRAGWAGDGEFSLPLFDAVWQLAGPLGRQQELRQLLDGHPQTARPALLRLRVLAARAAGDRAALAALEEALRRERAWRDDLAHARRLTQARQLERAREVVDAVLQAAAHDEACAHALLRRAEIALQGNDLPGCRRDLEESSRFASLDLDRSEAWALLARPALMDRSDGGEWFARHALGASCVQGADSSSLLLRAALHGRLGERQQGEFLLSRAVLHCERPTVRHFLVRALLLEDATSLQIAELLYRRDPRRDFLDGWLLRQLRDSLR